VKPKKAFKTRITREIDERELNRRPEYDLQTLKRRFILQKFNKMGEKIYNQDEAKDYRNLKSDFNKQMLESKSIYLF
jgi:hypothetical protein